MTEAEWHTFTTPDSIPHFLRFKSSRRKLLLFACAQERQLRGTSSAPGRHQLKSTDPRFSQVEFMERYADGLASEEERLSVLKSLCAVKGEALPDQDFERVALARHVRDFVECGKDLPYLLQRTTEGPASLLHEIFGNPFRSVTSAPCWATLTVKQLAASIYDERAFDRLIILADALEDAGCDNQEILGHLRGPGPHFRGCFAVDLLLGKE